MTGEMLLRSLVATASNSCRRMKDFWPKVSRVLFFSLADDIIAFRKSVCISIEDSRLVAVRGSKWLSRTTVQDYREYAFEGGQRPPADRLASLITFALRDLKAANGGFSLVISKSSSIIAVASLPPAVKENISSAVEFELDRITPLSPAGAYYDFSILDESRDRLEVMIAAAPAVIITPLLDSLRKTGAMPKGIAVGLPALGTFLGFSKAKGVSIFIEGTEDSYNGICVSDGKIRRVFSGSYSQEGASLAALLKGPEGPQVYIKSEDLASAENLKKTGIPFKTLDRIDTALSLKNKNVKPDSAVVGGLLESLWPAKNGLNLLTKGKRQQQKLPLAPTLIISALLLAAAVFSYVSPIYRDVRTVEEIESRIQAGKDEVLKVEALKKEAESIEKEITFISDFRTNKPLTIDLVKEITSILPRKAWLTRIKITERSVEIEGQAPSATELLPVLEASKLLKKVEFSSPTLRDMKTNADRFAIKMEIENADGNTGLEKKQ